MAGQTVSLLKPKVVSAGLSVCRTNDGQIVISSHEENHHILLEVSDEECLAFAKDLLRFCGDGERGLGTSV